MSELDPTFAAEAARHENYGGDWVAGDPDDLRRRYDAARAGLEGDVAPGVEITSFDLHGEASGLHFSPEEAAASSAAIVYFHGGSWMVGSARTHMVPCSWLAALTGLPVWSVDYRLVPEHPYPSQREDGARAVAAVLAAGAARVVIAGDSAGAAVSFWTFDALPAHLRPSVAGIAAFYGAYGRLPSGDDDGPAQAGLSRPELVAAYRRLGPLDRLAAEPGFAVIEALESEGPPCFVSCGTHDAILPDSEVLAARLKELGRDVTFDLVEGLPHSFLHYAGRVPAARAAIERGAAWIRRTAAG